MSLTAPWPMTPAQQVVLADMCNQRLCDGMRDAGECQVPDSDKVVSWSWSRLTEAGPLGLPLEPRLCTQGEATLVTVRVERQVWA